LRTLQQKVEGNTYDTLQEFIDDVERIFKNAKFYNDETTPYFKHASKLEKFFGEKLKLKRAELGL
jgi:histone acetyltransferase